MSASRRFLSLAALLFPGLALAADVPLAPWKTGVQVHEVVPGAQAHTIHTYFNTCPESRDGRSVLYFRSTTANGHTGVVCVRDRSTGAERVLTKELSVEDAHRAACQQWLSGGKRVSFHGERDGEWFTAVVDLDSGAERVLAKNKLSCWGQPDADILPLYGPHWQPDALRDLELCDVSTGQITTALTAAEVKAACPQMIAQAFGDKPFSIFFPELSPDRSRAFFKLATPTGTDPRSKAASQRQGLVCYDLKARRLLFKRDQWGHPCWHPDGRRIVEVGYQFIDSDTGKVDRVADLPPMGSGHPSMSPDGKLIVTDLTMDHLGGKATDWAIVVCDARGGSHVVLHTFDNSHGAKSWRVSHPHPVFSPDGKRIYFNVSSGPWTTLTVAEAAAK